MAEFPDPRSVTGTFGALTVVGDVYRFTGWTYPPRFWLFKHFKGLGYGKLDDLRSLYSLRWTVLRFPGSVRRTLVFETIFHGDWEQYLQLLVLTSKRGVNAHTVGAIGYPGLTDVGVFVRYLFEKHHPASHVFAATPHASLNDLRAALTYAGSTGAIAEPPGRCHWFGVLVPLRRSHVGEVNSLLTSWKGDRSPFHGTSVHHGRVVVIPREGTDFLLISAAFASQETRRDAAVEGLLHELLAEDRLPQWRELLFHADVPLGGASAVWNLFQSCRFGHVERQVVEWTQETWLYRPSVLQSALRKYVASFAEAGAA